MKAIDGWKEKAIHSQHRYLGLLAALIAALGSAKTQTAFVSMVIIGVSLNFAFVQLALLILLGALLLKLQVYRLANVFLLVTTIG